MFGEVSEGEDILDMINESIVDNENRPYKDVRQVVLALHCSTNQFDVTCSMHFL